LHFKHTKYASTRASGEFTQDTNSQREKMHKSGIAYAPSGIWPFSLATLPIGYS
jgi:hypothetical protein